MKEKVDKLDFFKTKTSALLKTMLREIEESQTERKYLQRVCLINDSSQTYKNIFFNSIIRKQNFKYLAKDPNGQFTKKDTWMTNKHIRTCSRLYINRELKIKITMEWYQTPIRTVKIQNTDNMKNQGGGEATGALVHCSNHSESL